MKKLGPKWIDLPPVWLFGALGASYVLAMAGPFPLGFGHPVFGGLGAVLIAIGLGLMGLAVFQMWRHNTTVIPHLEAAALVQSGIFSRTRNPIYLGDMLVLVGCILRWDAVLALPLVPVLGLILRVRFIEPEEARLRRTFGADFERYAQNTRRWL